MSAAWSGLLRLLGAALAAFFAVIPNYGISIMLLTVAMNALLFPLTLKQVRSMRAMQAIQPQAKAIREQWKHDREHLNQETMALYKENGVNPAAGCLPTLLQLPIWIALFRVLRNSVGAVPVTSALHAALEAGQTGFLGVDLLVTPQAGWRGGPLHALPYLVLVLAVVTSSFAQQRRTMARMPESPSDQQRTMQRIMKYYPIMIGFFSWRMPAGLVLYWTTSQSLRTAQQLVLARLDRSGEGGQAGSEDEPAADTAPTSGETEEQPERRPLPHPRSKKRKRRRRP